MPVRTGGMVPLISTVIPYSTAAETVNTIVYATGGTNPYATTYESFYQKIATTAPDQTDACLLTKCILKAQGCANDFTGIAGGDTAVDVTDYYQVQITDPAITIGTSTPWAVTAQRGWVNGYKKYFCY